MAIGSGTTVSFCGMQMRTCSFMVDRKQVRFPRSKKKRIRKKWAKQQKNYGDAPTPEVVVMGNTVVGHPAIIARIKKVAERLDAEFVSAITPRVSGSTFTWEDLRQLNADRISGGGIIMPTIPQCVAPPEPSPGFRAAMRDSMPAMNSRAIKFGFTY